MGWFGFEKFYTRPGAGVYRNAPQKKSTPRRFFEIFGRKFTRLVQANLLYILLSLPVLTGGLAEAGLTFITRSAARGKFAYPAHDFFRTVRRTWKQALPAGLITLLVNAVLGFNVYFYAGQIFFPVNGAAPVSTWLLLGVTLLGMLIFSFMNYYVSLMIITFDLTLKQIYKNAVLFAFFNFKQNFLIFLSLLGTVAVAVMPMLFVDIRIWLIVLGLLYILIYPSYRSLLIQITVFPFIKKTMIDPYYKDHPDADRKGMRALGLEDTDPDAVFSDRPEQEGGDKP
ncbi:MAG: DUF624 domain-containing protein [Clostridia bacterium]|nr:DUF624 domain-containing protein [Clostridia bacterium]